VGNGSGIRGLGIYIVMGRGMRELESIARVWELGIGSIAWILVRGMKQGWWWDGTRTKVPIRSL